MARTNHSGVLTAMVAMVAAAIAATFMAYGTASAQVSTANTITVNTTEDESTSNGKCSLREAITNANANAQTSPDCTAGNTADAQDIIVFS